MGDNVQVVSVVLLGLLVIAVSVLAFRVSERQQRPTPPATTGEELDGDLVRLLSVLRTASVVLDAEDAVVRATPSAYALGLARGGHLVHPELVELVTEARREGGIRQVQLTLPRGPVAGAGRLILHAQIAALSGQRVLLLAEDRTAAVRLDEVRRDFVANVSHELKTPVGAIALLAETLEDAADEPDVVREFSRRLAQEARRLSALVQDIIDLSRVQDADALLDSRVVDVDAVVTEAVSRNEVEARARDIAIAAPGGSGLQVFGDEALLVTAVRNLVDNALRYSDGGTRVTVAARSGRDGLVEIAVIDQGIGIDADLLPRVFERFYRVDAARSRQTGGTGLGLAIVKHVAADHGGEVTVWSQPGRGSTFTLRLPSADSPTSDSAAAAPAAPAAAAPAAPAPAAAAAGPAGPGSAAPAAAPENGPAPGAGPGSGARNAAASTGGATRASGASTSTRGERRTDTLTTPRPESTSGGPAAPTGGTA
ncbi:cell wall metabolism sensor histidine kinase WalK [Miniimonas sp. S16]|nr:ATP-binding protein [Miniimonas sp. S16]